MYQTPVEITASTVSASGNHGLQRRGRDRDLVKQEATDDNLLLRKNRKFTMSDIPVDPTIFRRFFVPCYFIYVMTRKNVFVLRDESLLEPMQTIWNKVFPCNPMRVTLDDSVKYVVRGHFWG